MKYAHLLFKDDEGVNLGDSVKKVLIDTNSPMFEKVREVRDLVREKYKDMFFYASDCKRIYTKKEIENARFFQMTPTRHFQPSGEECGTTYDETQACPVCGSGAKQMTPLQLRKSSIPHVDIAETIARGEEIVVSEHFKELMEKNHITGIRFAPVYGSGRVKKETGFYQIFPEHYLDFSRRTLFGLDPFDLTDDTPNMIFWRRYFSKYDWKRYFSDHDKEVNDCPNGDKIGLNILSEAYIKDHPMLDRLDFFASRQTIGVRRGLLRPFHLLFCSNRMMRLIKDNKLKGFYFEVAHIVEE